jgi:hypothetical protein
MTDDLTGRCLCGAVTVTIRGDHDPRVGACHCRMCQRWSGGLFLCFNAPAASVTVEGEVREFQSSAFARRGFCPACGSHLWFNDAQEGGDRSQYELCPASSTRPATGRCAPRSTPTAPWPASRSGRPPRETRAEYEAQNPSSKESAMTAYGRSWARPRSPRAVDGDLRSTRGRRARLLRRGPRGVHRPARPPRGVVEKGIQALQAVWHRGAWTPTARPATARASTSRSPFPFFHDQVRRTGHEPDTAKLIAVGQVFLPRTDFGAQERCRTIVESEVLRMGHYIYGWRHVPWTSRCWARRPTPPAPRSSRS